MPESPSEVIRHIFQSQLPKQAQAARVVQGQHTVIRDRTAAGTDGNGQAFAGYSTKPITLYLYGKGSRTHKQKVESTKRSFNAIKKQNSRLYPELKPAFAKHILAGQGIRPTKSGLGIHFPGGYKQAKESFGRANVDLFGLVNHPHMLNQIVVRPAVPIPNGISVTMGIFNQDAADRATGHVEGTKHLPKRDFWVTSEADLNRMQQELEQLI